MVSQSILHGRVLAFLTFSLMFFSDIPSGCGTNRNEAAHKNINKFLKNRMHISSEVMLALLHSYFYMHNAKAMGKKMMQASIDVVKNMSINAEVRHRPTIGFPSKNLMTGFAPQYLKTTDDEIMELVRHTLILESETKKMPNFSHMSREDMLLSCEFQALPECELDQMTQEHIERVDRLLSDAGLKRVATPMDGNCLFTTTGYILQKSQLTDEYKEFLSSNNVNHTNELREFAQELRHATVRELEVNYEYYKHFDESPSQEAYNMKVQEYNKEGHFAGNFGDLLIFGLANALRSSINMVCSHQDMPFFHVQPRDSPINNDTLLLAFIACGPGHYDATERKISQPIGKRSICVCGRKGKGNVACHTQDCKCFKARVSCGTDPSCRCRNCHNRYGKRGNMLSEGHRCRCGQMKKVEPVIKPCSTTKCPCFLRGKACTGCGCKFCSNRHGKQECRDKGSRKTTPRKISAAHKNKLERTGSSDYLSQNDFVEKSIKWTLRETILLNQIVTQKKLVKPFIQKKVCALFNEVIQKNPEMGTIKTMKQIQCKLAHMSKVKNDK